MVSYLLLWPSEGTAVRRISLFFGGSDLSDALGHIVLIFVETNLSFILLRHYHPQDIAARYAVRGTLVFALFLETAQFFIPGRGAALIDFAANALGVSLFSVLARLLQKSSE